MTPVALIILPLQKSKCFVNNAHKFRSFPNAKRLHYKSPINYLSGIFSVSNISSPETTDGGVLSLASSSNCRWPLQPPERCGFLLFSFYSLPIIMNKAFREDVMPENHSLLRMAVSTPRYSSRCGDPTRSPSLSRARHAETSFPVDAHQGTISCDSKHWDSMFTLFPISVLTFNFFQLQFICAHTYYFHPCNF